MNVICFGDSNTYGYDPRSYFGSRYPAECRWVDILASETGWEVHNNGMNGREIPRREVVFPKSTDLLIVMLGTNDVLQGCTIGEIRDRMESFLRKIQLDHQKILLLSPPALKRGEWVGEEALIHTSMQLAETYCSIARQRGIRFADAGRWNVGLAYDGVHFTEDGHKAFAKGLVGELTGQE